MRRHAAGIVGTALVTAVVARFVAPWNLGIWGLLVPWLLALAATRTWRGALASAVAMSVAYSAVVFWWFPLAMADYASVPVWVTAAIVLIAAPLFQPELVAFALARHAARRRGLGAVAVACVGACAFVGTEWAV